MDSVSQVDVDSRDGGCLCLTLRWVMDQYRNNGFYKHLCVGESSPPAITLKPENLVPPLISLTSFELLPSVGVQGK